MGINVNNYEQNSFRGKIIIANAELKLYLVNNPFPLALFFRNFKLGKISTSGLIKSKQKMPWTVNYLENNIFFWVKKTISEELLNIKNVK